MIIYDDMKTVNLAAAKVIELRVRDYPAHLFALYVGGKKVFEAHCRDVGLEEDECRRVYTWAISNRPELVRRFADYLAEKAYLAQTEHVNDFLREFLETV